MFLRNLLLAVGAAFVLAGVIVLFNWFGQVRRSPGVVETTPVESRKSVLVAAHAIPRGISLRPDDFKFKDVAPEQVLPGNIEQGQENQFLGAVSKREPGYQEGEPLVASDFVKKTERGFVAARLRPGYRAITIFVDAAQGDAGLALPEDYVDVLLTLSFDEKDSKTVTTNTASGTETESADKYLLPLGFRTAGETVLRNAKVLAIGQAETPPSTTFSPVAAVNDDVRVARTVTLEVSERDAEKLLVAAKLGSFQLAVRPLEAVATDAADDKRNAKPVWASDVSQAIKDFSALRSPVAAAPKTPEVSVRVYGETKDAASAGYLCSKSACVPSETMTVTPELASQTLENKNHAIPIELR